MTNYEIVLKARLDEAQKRIAELEDNLGVINIASAAKSALVLKANKRIAELKARLKESGRIMAQLAEAAEDDGVDGVRWRAIAGDAYDFINAPEGYADD